MHLRLSALVERLRGSLFFVPMLYVVGGVILAEVTLSVDLAVTDGGSDLPLRLTSTVESARSILSTVASATMSFAGIAFSIALLIFQLTSSQYSPRVVHGLFRDPFNKQVMGIVVGTFTYCLLVLRTVRSPIESGTDPIIPHLSVALAVLLGIGTVLATIAFINHAAHRMDVSEILDDVTEDTLERIRARPTSDANSALLSGSPDRPGFVVRFDGNGWIQQFDEEALLGLPAPGGTARMETAVGRYAFAGTKLCTIWPAPDTDDEDAITERALAAVHLGETRTMQQDHAYGLRQLVDVALRALSPGVNDPTTAQDAIFHATAVLHAMLRSPTAQAVPGTEGRRLLLPEALTSSDLIGLAYDELRLAAAPLPTVCIYLLEAMALLTEALEHDGRGTVVEPIREQARLLLAATEAADLPAADAARVRAAHAKRFPAAPSA